MAREKRMHDNLHILIINTPFQPAHPHLSGKFDFNLALWSMVNT